ncbi:MFS transporter [Actinomycetales bacterium JB111]|nr:MFS transporter [Actinomycetales bacterium JB111]
MVLAVALLAVELIAGMQTYLSQTVLPLVALELDGAGLYGVLSSAASASGFLMMPIGTWLLGRFRVAPVMLVATAVTCAGAVLCALAWSMPAFIAGTAVRGMAGGTLATVSMGAVVRGLPARHRHLVLAGMSGVWVISSLVGPTYAALVASWLSWRWAMIAYLPVLLLARGVVAASMPAEPSRHGRGSAPWGWSAILAVGAAVLALPVGPLSAAAVVVGAVVVLRAARALLPDGALGATRGRRAGLPALMIVTGVYFGATGTISVVAHDAYGLGPARFGPILAASGLAWAVTGLVTGARPRAGGALRRRVLLGAALLTVGIAALVAVAARGVAGAPVGETHLGLLAAGVVLGLGMGTIYPSLLGALIDDAPREGEADATGEAEAMAGGLVLAEAVGTTIATTAAFSWLGTGFGLDASMPVRALALYLVLAAATPWMIRRLGRATSA